MIFKKYNHNITFYRNTFELGEVFTHGSLMAYVINKKYLLPWTISSIGCSSNVVVKKFYSEYLERAEIGFQIESDSDIYLFYLYGGRVEKLKRKEIAYGYSDIFGIIDTTGSASGYCCSSKIVTKALCEILEKNELLLFWYGHLGKEYILTEYNYDKLLRYFNDLSYIIDKFKIFVSSNLSNGVCCFVFLFSNGKLVGSGISLDLSFEKAFVAAVQEAKNLTVIYRNKPYGHYKNLTDNEHATIYNYLFNWSNYNYKIDLTYKYKYFKLNKELEKDLRLAYLNLSPSSSGKTVKIYSEYLYNCIPVKHNIERKSNKNMIKDFNINLNDNSIPNCCIL